MAFPRLVANDSVVGIDIGSRVIKIMHAELVKQGVRVTHVAMCPTPPASVKDGVVVDTTAVASAIKFALRLQGIKTTGAVAAIVGPGVTVRQVQMPKMSESALRKSIRFEAGRFISTSIEDSIVEFDILKDPIEEGHMNVVLAAAPRAMIDSRVIVLEEAGLEPLAIDVEVFAAMRALVDYGDDTSIRTGTIAMLDMGASHTEINLISNGRLALTRTIPIAGDSLSNAIKNAEGCNDDEAERKKYALDLTDLIGLPPGSTDDATLRVVQSLIDELLREIRRSINYYQSQLGEGTSDAVIKTLYLSGGTSRLSGLAEYTKSRLGIDVTSANPMLIRLLQQAELSGTGEEDIPLLGVAFGLAVRELSNNARIVFSAA
jgi:type IV pilus assembly protein PilM